MDVERIKIKKTLKTREGKQARIWIKGAIVDGPFPNGLNQEIRSGSSAIEILARKSSEEMPKRLIRRLKSD